MIIKDFPIESIKPFDRNAKKHDETQIKNVAESIRQFGFAQPLVIDKNNVLIIGHCRLMAAKRLGLASVPVLEMSELTDEQVEKLRLLDNKLNESDWDMELLLEDVPRLDFSDFNIDWELPEIEQAPQEEEEPEEEDDPFSDIEKMEKHYGVPYEQTDKKSCDDYGGRFDSIAFYKWAKEQPYQVFFSSYEISDKSFHKVKIKSVMSLIGANTNGQFVNEYLYSNRPIECEEAENGEQ